MSVLLLSNNILLLFHFHLTLETLLCFFDNEITEYIPSLIASKLVKQKVGEMQVCFCPFAVVTGPISRQEVK